MLKSDLSHVLTFYWRSHTDTRARNWAVSVKVHVSNHVIRGLVTITNSLYYLSTANDIIYISSLPGLPVYLVCTVRQEIAYCSFSSLINPSSTSNLLNDQNVGLTEAQAHKHRASELINFWGCGLFVLSVLDCGEVLSE